MRKAVRNAAAAAGLVLWCVSVVDAFFEHRWGQLTFWVAVGIVIHMFGGRDASDA